MTALKIGEIGQFFPGTSFSRMHTSQGCAGDAAARGYHGNGLTRESGSCSLMSVLVERAALGDKGLVHGLWG